MPYENLPFDDAAAFAAIVSFEPHQQPRKKPRDPWTEYDAGFMGQPQPDNFHVPFAS
jgi:hypothetical protein